MYYQQQKYNYSLLDLRAAYSATLWALSLAASSLSS